MANTNASAVKKDKKITWKEIKRQKTLLIISFITVVYGFIFCYWPLTGWIMAFQQYKPKNGLLHSKFESIHPNEVVYFFFFGVGAGNSSYTALNRPVINSLSSTSSTNNISFAPS